MSTTERIEFETEQSRARVAELLDEIRARFSLGEMVDQVLDYAGDGTGREILNRLGEQVRSNPLSCLMIGGGFAWLLLSDRRQRSSDRNGGEQPLARSRQTLGQYAASVSGAAQQVGETLSDAGEAMAGVYEDARHVVSQAARSAADAATSLGQTAADTARHTAARARDLSDRAATGVNYLLNEQPLVLAGMGVAIGAAIGAALPESEIEDRLMGEVSDELKDRVREVADEVKSSAAAAIDATDEGTREAAAEPNPQSFEAH
jgi:hypothetical protein